MFECMMFQYFAMYEWQNFSRKRSSLVLHTGLLIHKEDARLLCPNIVCPRGFYPFYIGSKLLYGVNQNFLNIQ